MKLSFLGGTGTVTGSKYLLEIENSKVLVDCGLFQGLKELRLRNWRPLPCNPAELDAVLITHAHIDHSGYLPLLVKNGFKGPIYATQATCDLCHVLLPDSAYLQEEDARLANRYNFSIHKPALPLYTQEDAQRALKKLVAVDYNHPYDFIDNSLISWFRAGHILGSAFIQIEHKGTKLLFSGDIGRTNDPIIKPSSIIEAVDYLVLESTYGNRLHETDKPEDKIAKIINETAKRNGTILIPAFAVGRAQSILYYLYQLKQKKRIPDLPIYLDSPMAIDATTLLMKHNNEHHLTIEQCKQMCGIATYVNTPVESIALDHDPAPKIIISASGMMTGGRILHHLKIFAPDAKNAILMTGCQATGTRGARLLAHETEIKIHGQMIPVNAQIEVLNNISAHADYSEILTWLKHFKHPPKTTFITHGEPQASEALQTHISSELGWNCKIPRYLEKVVLK